MTVAERMAVLERWIAASGGRGALIAHVGAEALPGQVALAKHAAAAGAAAIAAMPPTFNKPGGVEGVMELLEVLAAAAPATPLYYYHIAIKTGVAIRCDKLLEAVAARPDRVPTFRGIKFTDFDMHIYANCVAFGGGAYDILSGRDEVLLAALAMGATGAVGSTYNYAGRLYNALIAAFRAGDMKEALRLQRLSQASIDLLLSSDYGTGVNIGKATMEHRLGGKHTGPPRYPARAMEPAAKARLHADLDAIGFFSW